jgi:hypothetical protein
MNRLVALLILTCAGAHPAGGFPLLASALTLGLHGDQHAHSFSVVAEEGHVDLVLSHLPQEPRRGSGRGAHHHASTPHHDDLSNVFSEESHVFHLTGDDAASATPRRSVANAVPLLAIAVTLPSPGPRAAMLFRRSTEPRIRGVDYLRTVVLLL